MIGTITGFLEIVREGTDDGLYPKKGWIGRCLCGGERFLTTSQVRGGRAWHCGCTRANKNEAEKLLEALKKIYDEFKGAEHVVQGAWLDNFSDFYRAVGLGKDENHVIVPARDDGPLSQTNYRWELDWRNSEKRWCDDLGQILMLHYEGLRKPYIAKELELTANEVNAIIDGYKIFVNGMSQAKIGRSRDVIEACAFLFNEDLRSEQDLVLKRIAKIMKIDLQTVRTALVHAEILQPAKKELSRLSKSVDLSEIDASEIVMYLIKYRSTKGGYIDERLAQQLEVISDYVKINKDIDVAGTQVIRDIIKGLDRALYCKKHISEMLSVNYKIVNHALNNTGKQTCPKAKERDANIHLRTRAWFGIMHDRCVNLGCPAHRNHGAKGEAISSGWLYNYTAFLRDMGECPEGHVLQKKDGAREYSMSTCSWVSLIESNEKYDIVEILDTKGNLDQQRVLAAKYDVPEYKVRKVYDNYERKKSHIGLKRDIWAVWQCREMRNRGYTYEEISELLKYSASTVRSVCVK